LAAVQGWGGGSKGEKVLHGQGVLFLNHENILELKEVIAV
jgi:hypothetical protein